MNRIRRVRRALARGASPPGTDEPHLRQPTGQEPGLVSRPGSEGLALRIPEDLAVCPSVAVSQIRPAPTNLRRRTIPTPRLLPHTIQLCIHCRQNRAGFWVSHRSDQTVRRP